MYKIYSWVAQPLDLSLPRLVFPPTPEKSHRRKPELLSDYLQTQCVNVREASRTVEQNLKGRVIAFGASIERSSSNVKIVEAGLVNRSKDKK